MKKDYFTVLRMGQEDRRFCVEHGDPINIDLAPERAALISGAVTRFTDPANAEDDMIPELKQFCESLTDENEIMEFWGKSMQCAALDAGRALVIHAAIGKKIVDVCTGIDGVVKNFAPLELLHLHTDWTVNPKAIAYIRKIIKESEDYGMHSRAQAYRDKLKEKFEVFVELTCDIFHDHTGDELEYELDRAFSTLSTVAKAMTWEYLQDRITPEQLALVEPHVKHAVDSVKEGK